MKAFTLHIVGLFILMLFSLSCYSQTTYKYSLISNFSSQPTGGPDLIQIPNNEGLTGSFVVRPVPASTCGQGGDAAGYFFEDDAGLQFNNPSGFINQSYSLAFNFQVEEFETPPSWVRILSFTHTDDVGVYIYLTNAPTNGTLQFWPYGNVGEDNFFTTVDFYQMILVRNDAGLIKIYVNGQEFAEYDDSQSQKFIPGDPDNYIVFFRDHPSVLANEASPGFVSDIVIGNFAWSANDVLNIWNEFCSSLLGVEDVYTIKAKVYPNPVHDFLHITLEEANEKAKVQIFDFAGRELKGFDIQGKQNTIDVSDLNKGVYMIKLTQDHSFTSFKFCKN